MTREEFTTIYGDVPQDATRNYSAKSVGTNYDVNDAVIEFIDNASDARVSRDNCANIKINYNEYEHTLSFEDDGTGIKDATQLIRLGGTDKETSNETIGKFGIGLNGATSSIATTCRYNKNEEVLVIFESAYKGRKLTKTIGYFGDALYIGEDNYTPCHPEDHYTIIKFTNIVLNNSSDIIDSIEETFEIPLKRENGISITFNNRMLGRSGKHSTFVGDEIKDSVTVGNATADIRYRIIGGNATKNERAFDEAGLRIYDKTTGRLLGKNTKYWSWYAGKEAQQNICGLRCGIFIDSDIDSYMTFGVLPAKNGMKYRQYSKTKEFSELSEKLKVIYGQAMAGLGKTTTEDIIIGSKRYIATQGKLNGELYHVVGDEVFIRNKYKINEIAELINENLTLKRKLEKKNIKTRKIAE